MRIDRPRLDPVRDSEATPGQLEVLGRVRRPDGTALNIFRTLAHHPDLMRRWMVFGNHVLAKSTLEDRDRELLILRIGWLCRAEYEWGQHVQIARSCGVTDDEIRRIQAGPEAAGWTDADRTLLRAADDLHRDQLISSSVWEALSRRLDVHQLMDLVFTVGQYTLVSMALNSFGVQLDDGAPGFEV
ncbi:MAG: carboxymuconolactone decarboxylase family protein [Acidimicrobiales bacterium]